MAQVITFERVTPIARYDETAWTEARIEESATTAVDSAYAAIDTIDLSTLPGGLDDDPANPASRNLTTELASETADLWYRIVFIDASNDESAATEPIQNLSPYTTLYINDSQVKNAASMVGETFADDELDIIVPAVCRAIDAYKKTTFYPQTMTRHYTPRAGALELPIYDLNTLTSIEVDEDGDGTWETEWTENVEFYLEPANAAADGIPYNRVIVNTRETVFPTYRNSVKVVGSFGWAQTPPQVKLAAEKLCVRELHQLRNAPMGIIVASDVAARLGSVYRDIAYLLDTLNPRPQVASLQVG